MGMRKAIIESVMGALSLAWPTKVTPFPRRSAQGPRPLGGLLHASFLVSWNMTWYL